MPKNEKSKKNSSKGEVGKKTREMIFSKDLEGTVYGKAIKLLGECNFTIFCFDGKERMCHIRKTIKRSEKIVVDSIVLVGLREYQDTKGDIVYVYSREQESILKRTNEIPNVSNGDAEQDPDDEEETGFEFDSI